MPNITLTPVGGDPFSGGATELDPTAHPPLTVSLAQQPMAALGATPQADPAPYGPSDPPSPDAPRGDVFDALDAGRAALSADRAGRMAALRSDPRPPYALAGGMPGMGMYAAPSDPAAAQSGRVIGDTLADAGLGAVDGELALPRVFRDVGNGSLPADSPDLPGRMFMGALSTGTLGMAGAEDGALGAAGGKGMAKAADDPFAAMMAALDKQGAAPVTRTMAETGIVDPSAAPWRLYHGTDDPTWSVFDPAKAGVRTSGAEKGALFMSPREGEAANYAHGDGARVLSLDVMPGNTGVYDAAQLLATRDPRFMAASRSEFSGHPAIYDDALRRYDADVAYHQDLRSRMSPDMAAEMPEYPAASNLLHPQSAAISMAREDGRDTAILRGLGESSGGDQVVALRPGFVRDADTEAIVYARGLPGSAAALGAMAQPAQPAPSSPAPAPSSALLAQMLRQGAQR